MGKGKVKNKIRKDAVFKVANGKTQKGKAKAVTTKLKSIKLQNSKAIDSLNDKFTDFQQANSSIKKPQKPTDKILPIGEERRAKTKDDSKNYDNILEGMEKMK